MRGRQWRFRIYIVGRDPGVLFKVRLQVGTPRRAMAIGPKSVLVDQKI